MKKIILIAACLLTLTTVNAQERLTAQKKSTAQTSSSTPEQRAQKHVDAIGSKVTLTEDQKPKIYDLALAKTKKAEEIKAKYKGEEHADEKAAALKAIRKEFNQSVKAILTPEQIEKVKAIQKENRAAGKESDMNLD